jgi:hypothetical protein
MATRYEVYEALHSERTYQAVKWKEKPHEIDAWVTYICGYADKLLDVASTYGDDKA